MLTEMHSTYGPLPKAPKELKWPLVCVCVCSRVMCLTASLRLCSSKGESKLPVKPYVSPTRLRNEAMRAQTLCL